MTWLNGHNITVMIVGIEQFFGRMILIWKFIFISNKNLYALLFYFFIFLILWLQAKDMQQTDEGASSAPQQCKSAMQFILLLPKTFSYSDKKWACSQWNSLILGPSLSLNIGRVQVNLHELLLMKFSHSDKKSRPFNELFKARKREIIASPPFLYNIAEGHCWGPSSVTNWNYIEHGKEKDTCNEKQAYIASGMRTQIYISSFFLTSLFAV